MSTLGGRILVTGGAGFIGSAVVWALNQRGHSDIVIADFLAPENRRTSTNSDLDEKRKNLRPLKFAEYVEADAFRRRLAREPLAFGRFTTIFHLGACSSTTESDAAYLNDNNLA
jgi:ADP-L-glycero-D-manno-heptose 6-epimerase